MKQEKNIETNETESNVTDKKAKEKTEKKSKIIDEKQAQIDELTDTLKRLQAEFENFKKRIDKEKAEFIGYASCNVISKLLPVLDSFELALKNTTNSEKFAKGVEMIYAQLSSLLRQEGLRKIEAEGKFDPYKHDVLLKEGSDKEEDTILEELQKGYMLKDRVLRHSKVKVSCKKEAKDSGQQQ